MASNLSIDLQSTNFCSAPSSSSSSSSTACSSSTISNSRAIDRHSPHLRDPLREKYLRFQTKPNSYTQKSRKITEKKSPQQVSPATSSRYLLHEISAVDNEFYDKEAFPSLRFEFEYLKEEENFSVTDSPSPPWEKDQVVVLKVSLHCKGCERKVRKHISKMKGVTSFSTDLATKKVTVTGDLSPLTVLSSVSKIKKAQFWPSS